MWHLHSSLSIWSVIDDRLLGTLVLLPILMRFSMVRHYSLLSFLLMSLLFAGCGNPFENIVDNTVEDTTGNTSSGDAKLATVSLTFADDASKPTEPEVGATYKGSRGEYAIIVGQMIVFSSYNGTPEEPGYPKFEGNLVHPDLRTGTTIKIGESSNEGATIVYAFDDETSWYAVSGEITIESTRPLKAAFKELVMVPMVNSIGEFSVNGTGTWQK
jgi:hypothetical protein